MGTEKPSMKLFLNILWIVCGVMIASLGEVEFNMVRMKLHSRLMRASIGNGW